MESAERIMLPISFKITDIRTAESDRLFWKGATSASMTSQHSLTSLLSLLNYTQGYKTLLSSTFLTQNIFDK